jgi:hypothetical protein
MLTRRGLLAGTAVIAVSTKADALFRHGNSMPPPILTLDTTTQNGLPQFTLTVPVSVTLGGTITNQSSTSSDFSANLVTTTHSPLKSSDLCAYVQMGASPLGANATYYFRASYNGSPWSNTVTLNLSVPTEPSTPTFVDKSPIGILSSVTTFGGYLYSDMDIGPPASDRVLIVCPVYNITRPGDIGPTDTIIGGGACYDVGSGLVPMTLIIKSSTSRDPNACSMWYANVPSGNTADILICGSSFNAQTLQYGVAYGLGASIAPQASAQVYDYINPSSPVMCPSSGSITIPANGFAVAVSQTIVPIANCSWSGGYTLKQSNSFMYSGGPFTSQLAVSTTAGSSVATLTGGQFSTSMCVAAWGP